MRTLTRIALVVLMTFLSAGRLRSQDLGDFIFSYGFESNLTITSQNEKEICSSGTAQQWRSGFASFCPRSLDLTFLGVYAMTSNRVG